MNSRLFLPRNRAGNRAGKLRRKSLVTRKNEGNKTASIIDTSCQINPKCRSMFQIEKQELTFA